MKIGDTKKAAILSAVAIGAIGFLVVRMIPAREPRVARAAGVVASAPTTADAVPVEHPMALLNDPFSHASLATKKSPDPQEPPVKPGAGDKYAPTAVPRIPGVQPYDPGDPNATVTQDNQDPKPKPPPPLSGTISGSATAPSAKGLITVTVSAVLIAGRRCAFISINDQVPVPYELGQRLSKNLPYRVSFIDTNGIRLTGAGKSKRFPVGEKATL